MRCVLDHSSSKAVLVLLGCSSKRVACDTVHLYVSLHAPFASQLIRHGPVIAPIFDAVFTTHVLPMTGCFFYILGFQDRLGF
jgi:hypothetical protein